MVVFLRVFLKTIETIMLEIEVSFPAKKTKNKKKKHIRENLEDYLEIVNLIM